MEAAGYGQAETGNSAVNGKRGKRIRGRRKRAIDANVVLWIHAWVSS